MWAIGDVVTGIAPSYSQGGVKKDDWQAQVNRKNARPEVELMPGERSFVSVVDDDESVRESLPDLLNEFGYSARTFSSALEFLTSDALEQTSCLLLDISMPVMTGIELQAELKRQDKRVHIIFISATRDETVRARVIELGAAACLTKPFSDTALLEALRSVMTAL